MAFNDPDVLLKVDPASTAHNEGISGLPNATLIGSPTTTPFTLPNGGTGTAIVLNGSSQELKIVSDPAFGSTSFTVACWAKTATNGQGGTGTLFRLDDGGSNRGFLVRLGGNLMNVIAIWGGNPQISTDNGFGPAFNDGNWHHFAVTFSLVSGTTTFKFYADGTQWDAPTMTQTVSGGMPLTVIPDLYMGGGQGLSELWTGQLCELRHYARALSGAEVAALYAYVPNPVVASTTTINSAAIAVNGSTLTAAFSGTGSLTDSVGGSTTAASNYSVSINGAAVAISNGTISGKNVTFTLAVPVDLDATGTFTLTNTTLKGDDGNVITNATKTITNGSLISSIAWHTLTKAENWIKYAQNALIYSGNGFVYFGATTDGAGGVLNTPIYSDDGIVFEANADIIRINAYGDWQLDCNGTTLGRAHLPGGVLTDYEFTTAGRGTMRRYRLSNVQHPAGATAKPVAKIAVRNTDGSTASFNTSAISCKSILFIGDSYTEGYWATSPVGGLTYNDYVSLVGKANTVSTINGGQGASNLFGQDVLVGRPTLNPDYLMIMMGINDQGGAGAPHYGNGDVTDAQTFHDEYLVRLGQLRADNPTAHIIVQGYLQTPVDTRGTLFAQAIRDAFATWADGNSELWDTSAVLTVPGDYDGVHPSQPQGGDKVNAYFLSKFSQLLSVTITNPTVNSAGTVITATINQTGCLPTSGSTGFSLSGTTATAGTWSISGTTLTVNVVGAILQAETPKFSAVAGTITNSSGTLSLAAMSNVDMTNNSTVVAPVNVSSVQHTALAQDLTFTFDQALTSFGISVAGFFASEDGVTFVENFGTTPGSPTSNSLTIRFPAPTVAYTNWRTVSAGGVGFTFANSGTIVDAAGSIAALQAPQTIITITTPTVADSNSGVLDLRGVTVLNYSDYTIVKGTNAVLMDANTRVLLMNAAARYNPNRLAASLGVFVGKGFNKANNPSLGNVISITTPTVNTSDAGNIDLRGVTILNYSQYTIVKGTGTVQVDAQTRVLLMNGSARYNPTRRNDAVGVFVGLGYIDDSQPGGFRYQNN